MRKVDGIIPAVQKGSLRQSDPGSHAGQLAAPGMSFRSSHVGPGPLWENQTKQKNSNEVGKTPLLNFYLYKTGKI